MHRREWTRADRGRGRGAGACRPRRPRRPATPRRRRSIADELAEVVRELEAAHHPRWVWVDTRRWYPRLLDAGVRVERCHDLAPVRGDPRPLDGDRAARVDRLAPRPAWLPPGPAEAAAARSPQPAVAAAMSRTARCSTSTTSTRRRRTDGGRRSRTAAVRCCAPRPTPRAGAADRARPAADAVVDELARQLALVEASDDPNALRLLLAAESGGALIGVEMQAAGLPWHRAVHEAVLETELGPRPAPGLQAGAHGGARGAGARRARRAGPSTSTRRPTCCGRSGAPASRSTRRRAGSCASTTIRRSSRSSPTRSSPACSARTAGPGSTSGSPTAGSAPSTCRAARRPGAGRPRAAAPCSCRRTCAARWSPIPAGRSWSPTPRSSSRGCSRAWRATRRWPTAGRGRDLYRGLVDAGVVATRDEAKIAILGAMYGATTGESGRLVPRLARAFPRAMALVDRAARDGERGRAVTHAARPVLAAAARPSGGRSSAARASPTRPRPTNVAPARPPATGAGSPATSSCRAARPSGRSAGWRRSAGASTRSAPASRRPRPTRAAPGPVFGAVAAPRLLPARRDHRAHAARAGR